MIPSLFIVGSVVLCAIYCALHCMHAVWAELYEFHTAQPIQKRWCVKDIAQYRSFDPPTQNTIIKININVGMHARIRNIRTERS